jgi:multiple sugar transport system substrate-binding protein
LKKVSIIHIYRKIVEKSRSFDPRRIDHFLFLAAIVLAAGLAAGNLIFRSAAGLGRTELHISSHSTSLFGKETMDDLIREFEKQNPELRIQIETQGAEDIVVFEETEYSGLVRDGVLASLDSYIYSESSTGQHAVPLVSFMDLLVYNIELLQTAGFTRPPKTRAEFLACAKAVSAINTAGLYGTALGLSSKDPNALKRDIFSWVWAAGGTLWPSDNPQGEPTFSGKAINDLVVFLRQLNQEGALAPGSFEKTGTERLVEFTRGNIAMLIVSARDISFLEKEMSSVFGITAVPGSENPGKTSLGLSGIYAGIRAGSAHSDEAWKFLAFFAEKSSALAAALKAVPGAVLGPFPGAEQSANTFGDYIQANPLYTKAWDIFEASGIARGLPGYLRADEFENGVRKTLMETLSPLDRRR